MPIRMQDILEYTWKKETTFPQDSPSSAPAVTRIVFQIRDPSDVNMRNVGMDIRAMPAGMEIRLRTRGIIRQKKTAFFS